MIPYPAEPPENQSRKPDEPSEYTEYAKRYGPSSTDPIAGIFRSRLTPTEQPLDIADRSGKQKEKWRKIAAYQRKLMHGFTSWELMDAGALNKQDADPTGLAGIAIDKFFARKRWLKGEIDIGEGFEGKFEGGNDVVWEALLPSLRLASVIIWNMKYWPWFDALIYGEIVRVPDEELTDGGAPGVCYSFHARPPQVAFADERELKILLEQLPHTRFQIFGGEKTGANGKRK